MIYDIWYMIKLFEFAYQNLARTLAAMCILGFLYKRARGFKDGDLSLPAISAKAAV